MIRLAEAIVRAVVRVHPARAAHLEMALAAAGAFGSAGAPIAADHGAVAVRLHDSRCARVPQRRVLNKDCLPSHYGRLEVILDWRGKNLQTFDDLAKRSAEAMWLWKGARVQGQRCGL